MIRPGTCITDEKNVDDEWVAACGCGRFWLMGQMVDVCTECVAGRCSHPKHGVDIEQMGMGL